MTSKKPARVQIRRLWPGDAADVAKHLKGLDAADRKMRFGRDADAAFVDAYCDRIDWYADVVLGAWAGSRLLGVGVLSLMGWDLPLSGAAALSVEKTGQRTGVGTELLRALLLAARNRFIQRVFVLCQTENVAMKSLAEHFGGRSEVSGGEVESLIEVGPPTPFSLAFEALSQGGIPRLASFEPCRPLGSDEDSLTGSD